MGSVSDGKTRSQSVSRTVRHVLEGECWLVAQRRALHTIPVTSWLRFWSHCVTNFSLCALSVLWTSVEFCDRVHDPDETIVMESSNTAVSLCLFCLVCLWCLDFRFYFDFEILLLLLLLRFYFYFLNFTFTFRFHF